MIFKVNLAVKRLINDMQGSVADLDFTGRSPQFDCQINGLYTCIDGPVFRYSDVADVEEAV